MSDEHQGPDVRGLAIAAAALGATLAGHYLGLHVIYLVASGTLISIVIWQACDPFAEAAQWIGTAFRIPGSVRGATLDAVASSMPELFTGLFFVWIALRDAAGGDLASIEAAGAEGFGATIATLAGSAIYNMILIPAAVVLAVSIRRPERPTVDVEPEVLSRDGTWFLVVELVLLGFLFQDAMHWWMAIVLMAMYVAYVLQLYLHARQHRQDLAVGGEAMAGDDFDDAPKRAHIFFRCFSVPIHHRSVWVIIAFSTAVAASACYFLVELTRETATLLQVPTFFVAVILAAAVSSVPDTFLSIGSAVRGDDSGAISNAFGSNIFDICIGLSIPLLLNSYLIDWAPVSMLENGKPIPGMFGLRIFLLVLTALTLAIFWHKKQLNRTKALILCALYLSFIAYAVVGSLGIVEL